MAAYYDTSSGKVNVAMGSENPCDLPIVWTNIRPNVLECWLHGSAVFIVSAYGLSSLKLKPFMGKVLRERS
jgi:hypothetical protein